MIPKVHLFQHLLKTIMVTARNPATHWVFMDESNIGLVKRTLKQAHATTLSKSGIEALLLFVCLHG